MESMELEINGKQVLIVCDKDFSFERHDYEAVTVLEIDTVEDC